MTLREYVGVTHLRPCQELQEPLEAFAVVVVCHVDACLIDRSLRHNGKGVGGAGGGGG